MINQSTDLCTVHLGYPTQPQWMFDDSKTCWTMTRGSLRTGLTSWLYHAVNPPNHQIVKWPMESMPCSFCPSPNSPSAVQVESPQAILEPAKLPSGGGLKSLGGTTHWRRWRWRPQTPTGARLCQVHKSKQAKHVDDPKNLTHPMLFLFCCFFSEGKAIQIHPHVVWYFHIWHVGWPTSGCPFWGKKGIGKPSSSHMDCKFCKFWIHVNTCTRCWTFRRPVVPVSQPKRHRFG